MSGEVVLPPMGERGEFRVPRTALIGATAETLVEANAAIRAHLRRNPHLELRAFEDSVTRETVLRWGPRSGRALP